MDWVSGCQCSTWHEDDGGTGKLEGSVQYNTKYFFQYQKTAFQLKKSECDKK